MKIRALPLHSRTFCRRSKTYLGANFEKALKNPPGPLSGPWQALIRKGPDPNIRIGPRRLFVNGGTGMLPCFDAF